MGYSRPCYKQGSNFTRGQYMRINHMSKPGSSRVYCAVLKRGSIRVGDKTILHVDTLGAKDYRNNADVVSTLARPSSNSTSLTGVVTQISLLIFGIIVGRLSARLLP